MSLDPIAYSEALQAAGMPRAQADVIARYQQTSFESIIQARDMATKKDLMELEVRLVKSFHNALFGFAGVIVAAFACAVALLK